MTLKLKGKTQEHALMLVCASIEEVTADEGFLSLREEWNALVGADMHATVFQTWELRYCGWKMIPDFPSPHPIVVRDESGRMTGCAPPSAR